jgi:hypothetical protein
MFLSLWSTGAFLFLQTDGRTVESQSAEMDEGSSNGVCLTLSTSESLNDVVESSLSSILERGGVDSRYYLSKKACQGILRRAETRGKVLPKELETALRQVVSEDTRVTESVGVCPTLHSQMGTGGGNVPFVLTPLLKQGTGGDCDGYRASECRDSGREMPYIELCSRTANLLRGGIMTICFLERAGCAGGGKGILCSEEKTFTLSTVDNMRICKMEEPIAFMGGQGAKAGGLGIGNQSPTLKSTNSGGNTVPCVLEPNTVVRRLTPVECERLQGFPDNYTNIPWRNKPTAPDSRRYKALGNSMAVPVMRWIGKRMMDAKEVVCDEAAIDRILYVTPSDDGQLSLF